MYYGATAAVPGRNLSRPLHDSRRSASGCRDSLRSERGGERDRDIRGSGTKAAQNATQVESIGWTAGSSRKRGGGGGGGGLGVRGGGKGGMDSEEAHRFLVPPFFFSFFWGEWGLGGMDCEE